MAEVGSLLGTAENLTNLWRARICKILRQKCRICKFLRQNFVFVNFCNKNVTFSNTRYPKIPDYTENISGRVRVLLKIIGSGRVSGTRLILFITPLSVESKRASTQWVGQRSNQPNSGLSRSIDIGAHTCMKGTRYRTATSCRIDSDSILVVVVIVIFYKILYDLLFNRRKWLSLVII